MADTNADSNTAVCSLEAFLGQQFDYLICGGGTAGLAVAARLTENPDVKVGVLEAGADRRGDPIIDVPAMFMGAFNNPDYDWQFLTSAQDHTGQRHHVPRGKVLGGSSAINYMMYVRGSDKDYDDWAALAEDESWSSKNMKKYMRKHQTLEPIDDSVTDRSTMPFVGENHGTSGPVKTGFNDYCLPIEDSVIKACDEVTGMTRKPLDPWSGDHIGFYNTLGSVVRSGPDRGKRSYSARGYLGQGQARPNLKVLCNATIARVDLQGNVAKGATFIHGGSQHSVSAAREVIVCGGTIGSPQILELSGIGDPEVLRAAGVECKVELPSVGNNFQDHSVSTVACELTPGNISMDAFAIPEVVADAQKKYAESQNGPLSSVSSCQGFFPYKLFATEQEVKETVDSIRKTADNATPFYKKQLEQVIKHLESDNSANLQLVLVASSLGAEEGVGDQSKLFRPPGDPSQPMSITLANCLQYPVSRGTIHITSSDPTKPPTIDPGYNRHPADIAVLGAGLKFADSVTKAKAVEGKIARRSFPDEKLDLQKTEETRKAAKDWVLGEYHACGSCAMGDTLDSHLRVKGVQGLRVADASVFPNNVSGNICSSVYAVAEKAADMIREDWDYAALNKAPN